jgi:mRNA interferase MazF
MAVSSRVREPLAYGEILIDAWALAGLPKPSIVKPVIATVQKDVVLQRLGRLKHADANLLIKALGSLLTLRAAP